jgi:methyl-accepting chemotaxis protein
MSEATAMPISNASQASLRKIKLGLRAKLFTVISLCFFATILTIAIADFRESRNHFHKSATSTAEKVSHLLSRQMSSALASGNRVAMAAIFDGFEKDEENKLSGMVVFDPAGSLFVELGETGYVAETAQVARTVDAQGYASSLIDASLYVATQVKSAQTGEVLGTVVAVWDRTVLNASIITALWHSLLLAGLCGAVGLIAIMLGLSRMVISPLITITETMDLIATKKYETEVPFTNRADEVGTVARNLRSFRDKLAQEEKTARHHAHNEALKTALFAELSQALAKVASGDMTPRVDLALAEQLDEGSKQVCIDFNALMDGFGDVIATVVSSADTVRTSSAEISEVANTQSRRSEAQASTLEESAAALDGLTKSVKSAAQHASEADAAVSENRRQAEDSGDVVRRAVSAMQQIEESSSQITQIISVIDDIAFQTNLLALNAGVEAARAGESGRGFAVVASEVRALAQRASESAREIKDLISTSGQQVSEGGALVSQTGDALSEIIGRFGKVSELVSNIAVSLREQSTGLEEINVGINELDKVTQQNAAVIEETSASSQALSGEAERLSLVLSKFKLRTDTRAEAMKAAVGSDIFPEAMQTAGADTATQRAAKIYEWSSDAMQDSSPSKIDEQDWQDF